MKFLIEVEGVAPGIVMNNPASMMNGDTKVPKPDQEAESKAYRLPSTSKMKKGELYIPGQWFMSSILSVASPYKLKLAGKSVAARRWLAGGSMIVPEKIPLGIQDFETYVTPAVVQSKSRVLRARPRIMPWRASFALQFSDADSIYDDIAKALENRMPEIIRIALNQSGIGDNRPGSPRKPGPHGRAKLIKCNLVE